MSRFQPVMTNGTHSSRSRLYAWSRLVRTTRRMNIWKLNGIFPSRKLFLPLKPMDCSISWHTPTPANTLLNECLLSRSSNMPTWFRLWKRRTITSWKRLFRTGRLPVTTWKAVFEWKRTDPCMKSEFPKTMKKAGLSPLLLQRPNWIASKKRPGLRSSRIEG